MYGFCNAIIQLLKLNHIPLFFLFLILMVINACNQSSGIETKKQSTDSLIYLNHSDSAKYVGINTCKTCHQNIYNTFIKTGMGQSFDRATKIKSKAEFTNPHFYDAFNQMHYNAQFINDSLYIHEYRLNKKDTTFSRQEQVNFIVGSGQHTNSHIQNVNGYLNQMPMTFYTQKKKWDLPPGFENGVNTRFSRKIGLECMSCHNAFPKFVEGSENKFESVPQGIDCERCHGPGSIHVQQKQNGILIDTSKYIDYSIVNPAKLSIEAQFDVCQRCHLQGNTILKEGKSFLDFKPGQKLSDYMTVFLPKYSHADKDFIMASHADRLKQSACFIKSAEKIQQKSLKPYQNAMTCITCHNPHVSVKETNKEVFNQACLNCHGKTAEAKNVLVTTHQKNKILKTGDCVSCHMPISGSTDIPHVSVHDHYIRKPISEKEKNQIKTFLGLYAVNEKNPDAITKAKAYINQYEKFEAKTFYLDSAEKLIKNCKSQTCLGLKIQLYFIQQNFAKVIQLLESNENNKQVENLFARKSLDNLDAWTCYRIGESYLSLNKTENALPWLKKAVKLAPYNLEFRNKLATVYASMNQITEAEKEWNFIMKENPKLITAYTNLGYIKLNQGMSAEAFRLFSIGVKLDPDNESLLLNLAAYYLSQNNKNMAIKNLQHILNVNPKNTKAKNALMQLKTNG